MPEINLTTLNGPELRRLLDATRARGEARTTYLILQEMAARREADARRSGRLARRRPPEARTIELGGDPVDGEDDVPPAPFWRPPPREAATPVAPAAAEPAAVGADSPAEAADPSPPKPLPLTDFRLPPPAEPPRRARRLGRDLGAAAAGFAAGVVATAALAWGVGGPGEGGIGIGAPPPVAEPPAAVSGLVIEAEPAAEAVTEAEPANALPPAEASEASPADAPAPPDLPEGPLTSPEAEPLAVESLAPAGPCAAEPTPADRAICADPELQRLQQTLRQAYARALDAHEDRALLRQRQLAWRDARSAVSDPGELARLYGERTRKLNAAAEAARRARAAGGV